MKPAQFVFSVSKLLPATVLLTAAACCSQPPAPTTPTVAPVVETEPATPVVAEPVPVPEAPPAPPPAPAAPADPVATLVASVEGFSTPESVYYDAAADRYLVSNINGSPTEKDGNGSIAVVSPEGKIINASFIVGTKVAKLDAPKGMAIRKGILYVADITVVRKYDAKTGKAKGQITVPGASFLNDITVAENGTMYVSDSGLKAGKEGFEPSGADAVYSIDGKERVKIIAKSPDLARPNGLFATAQGVWMVPFGGKQPLIIDEKGGKLPQGELPMGGLDGVAAYGKGMLISSWEGSAVYYMAADKTWPIISNIASPADLAVDSKRNRVLVPRFTENKVDIYQLPELP